MTVERAIEKATKIYGELTGGPSAIGLISGTDPQRATVIVQIATLLLAHDEPK